jgi:LETM1 and EF-hand domain-containing protein 1
LATETSTTTSAGGNYPPPGFNAEQAKKPLPKEEQQKSNEKTASLSAQDVKIPKDEPTSSPKTAAMEKQSLSELAAGKAAAEAKGVTAKKEEEKKKTLWQKVKHEAQHYWDGTKLLVAEVKISSKLALKMAAGYELTRREHRQVGNSKLIDQDCC